MASYAAPVIAAFGRVHPIAKQARNEQAKSFDLGQAPHRCLIPALGFALRILPHAGDPLDLGADQSNDRRDSYEGCAEDH